MEQIKRIIVIDDDETVGLISWFVVKKCQPQIEYVSFLFPEQGLEYIVREYSKNPVPSILLLDINMATLSGWETLDLWQKIDAHILNYFYVFMFSSSIYNEDRKFADANAHIIDFVDKPLTVDKLNQMLTKTSLKAVWFSHNSLKH